MNELDNIRLTDLIDAHTLQAIQDGFSNATGMAALTTDETGEPVTHGSNFTDFCMNFTRRSGLGCQRCEKCDRQGGQTAISTGKAAVYSCHAGLVDFAAPIMLNGKFLGSFIGGQVLTEPVDEVKFRTYAAEIGVDSDEYVRAAKKAKVVPRKQVEYAADFLCTIASILSKTAYSSYMSKAGGGSDGSGVSSDAIVKIHNAEDLIKKNNIQMTKLKEEVNNLESIAQDSISKVKMTMETVKDIQDIASNTRILGFNAYIEASHAKENGKGFGVVTQEIRSLADQSMESANKIEEAIKSISTSNKQINDQIRSTQKIINECNENAYSFSKILEEIYK